MPILGKQTRRIFLRGVGGAVVAAPFLGSIVERLAKAQGQPVSAPRRLIIMFTHYGCLTDRWFPRNSNGVLVAEDFAGTSLEALAPHADKLLLPRGIRAMNEWTSDVSLGQGNDPLLQVVGSYFTCVPVSPHSSDPFDITNVETRFNAMPTAPSLDHVCAQQLGPDGLPFFMRVGGMNEEATSAISYSASKQLFPGFDSPTQALAALAALPGTTSDGDYHAVRQQSVVDMVQDDLEALERHDMSASDKHKLAVWKELLHETSGGILLQTCRSANATSLGLTQANTTAYDGLEDRLASKITDNLDGADLYSNIAVLSALCDANRVIVLKYPASYVFRGLGITSDSRGIAARVGASGTGICLENANELIMTIDRFYAAKFAHLVKQLDSFPEGDGTLLDNTAAVWFQQFSDGAAMNLNNMPIIQAGSCSGYFKTGCAVNVDGGASDLHRGNSSAGCDVVGAIDQYKATGTPAEFGNAPINKYYCNLMNAIGVKAGADGFPAVGGTEVVTHFGMYDDTRDFASGGENPPRINSPGEFAELRAGS